MEAVVGARVLGEVEELSLEEILNNLRITVNTTVPPSTNINSTQAAPSTSRIKLTHIPILDQIAARHFRSTQSSALSISGRHFPLLYTLISTLVSPPHLYALLIIDLDARFDPTCLTCSPDHIRHIYVHRPAKSSPEKLRAMVTDAEAFMLYGDASKASAAREWWGTIVIGGLGAGDVVAGWQGWLRVERESVRGFALGISAEEALEQRERRQEAVEKGGWAASSQWGGFVFRDGEEVRE